jgi:hypothetical protein
MSEPALYEVRRGRYILSKSQNQDKEHQKVSRWIRVAACAVILFELSASSAPADEVTVDFYVTATSDLNLAFTGLELVISPVGTPASIPSFLASNDQPTAFLDDPSYVFQGQSSDSQFGLPFWNPPFTSPPPNNYPDGEINGGDAVYNAASVTLTANQTYLLAEVTYSVPSSGDTFTVGVVNDSSQTYFQDENGNNYTITSFDGSTNTFTIAAAVPEPSSSTMLAISSSLGGLLWYRRHRKTSVKAN